MTRDPSLHFYDENAALYAARDRGLPERQMTRFVERLPPGARILELGCGAGGDSDALLARGFDVISSDGSAAMAAEAERRLGRPVVVLPFQQMKYEAEFDGIWANACLLHVPRAELPDVLGRIIRALHPGGRFYASFKTGVAEGWTVSAATTTGRRARNCSTSASPPASLTSKSRQSQAAPSTANRPSGSIFMRAWPNVRRSE